MDLLRKRGIEYFEGIHLLFDVFDQSRQKRKETYSPKTFVSTKGKNRKEESDNSKPNLINDIWPSSGGVCIMSGPPSIGKTLSVLKLMKDLDLSSECIMYAGNDEKRWSINEKLDVLGYDEFWPMEILPDGTQQEEAWQQIKEWEEQTRENEIRFLILDLLIDYVDMNIYDPVSIKKGMGMLQAFAVNHKIVVIGLCHSTLNSSYPIGHQSIWGKTDRLLTLQKSLKKNTVDIHVTRRGPKLIIPFTHDWIDMETVEESTNRSSESKPKETKVELGLEWLKRNPEIADQVLNDKRFTLRALAEFAKNYQEDPLDFGKDTWAKVVQEYRELLRTR